MKKNDLIELRKQPAKAIKAKVQELTKELVESRMQMARGELTNLKQVKNLKADIAKLKTILREQEIMEESK